MEPLPIDTRAIVDEIVRRTLLTQDELAKRAGISQQSMSAYWRGTRKPSLDTLQRIAAGARFQLRLSLEPLAADVAHDLANMHRLPPNQWLDDVQLLWHAARGLVENVPHRVEGAVAARLQGVPVQCSTIELAVIDDDDVLRRVIRNAQDHYTRLREPASRWRETPQRLEYLRSCVDHDQTLHWAIPDLADIRMRLVSCLDPVLIVRHDDHDVPVVPLSELTLSDPRTRRILEATLELRQQPTH